MTNKSTFVTVLSWLFIVGSAFATFGSLMQNIMFSVVFKDEFSKIPQNASFFAGHFQVVLVVFFLLSILMLVASVGLLKRKNWARIIFIVFLAFGIVWMVGALVFQVFFFNTIPPEFPDDPTFQKAQAFMNVFISIFSVVISALFIWIIKRLLSAEVKEEFLVR